jgi:preprotein translocase subunit SecE
MTGSIKSKFNWVCSSAGRAAVSKAAGRGFESLRTRKSDLISGCNMVTEVKSMEIKKIQSIAASSPKETQASQWKPQELIGDIKDEFTKISWTNPEELKTYTQIVVGATFFFGIGIYAIDLLIHSILNGLAFAIRFISG